MARTLEEICGIASDARDDLKDAYNVLKDAHDVLTDNTVKPLIEKIKGDLRLSIELLARISVDPHPIKLEDISLKSSIQRILRMTGLEKKDLEVEINIDEEADIIFSSEIEILRIVGNLLKNAYNAMDKESKKITIELKLNESGEIEVTIADNGPGLPEKIKNAFSNDLGIDVPRVDDEDGDSGREHGYGLESTAVATKLIGGRLELVKSTVEGTTFRIALPKILNPAPTFSLSEDAEIALRQSKRIIHDVSNGLADALGFTDKTSNERPYFAYTIAIEEAINGVKEIFESN